MYTLTEVTNAMDLKELERISLFTWEGMNIDSDNLEAIEQAIEGVVNKVEFVYWKGELMNDTYNLKGNKAYPNDLTFLGVRNLYNPLFKLRYGARWLDDIVANNMEV